MCSVHSSSLNWELPEPLFRIVHILCYSLGVFVTIHCDNSLKGAWNLITKRHYSRLKEKGKDAFKPYFSLIKKKFSSSMRKKYPFYFKEKMQLVVCYDIKNTSTDYSLPCTKPLISLSRTSINEQNRFSAKFELYRGRFTTTGTLIAYFRPLNEAA